MENYFPEESFEVFRVAKLHSLYKLNIIRVIKSRRMRWE
jgi:hypothetical protein